MTYSPIQDVLDGRQANYILPLFWQKGESEAAIREEMARVHASGIGAVCVEARPHPDFLGPRWWHDFDIIMEEARQRGMRVWLLDDDHFPTGHAAGKLVDASPELRRQFLQVNHIDAIGPRSGASFFIPPWMTTMSFPPYPVEGMHLLTVVAARRAASSDALTGEFVDISAHVHGNILRWDVPAGHWRVFMVFVSPTGGSESQKDYLNPLVAESTRVLLDTVYEPFYAHYAADFGKTFAGFFSDEPGFYNDKQTFDFESRPGKKGVSLPWCPGLLERLEANYGAACLHLLPLLWHDCGSASNRLRYAYMDVISALYAKHFTEQIGDWCRAHGVDYIGHLLEDNGVHARLGPGTGHYFRGLWGQDMAGLDVVLWQLVPGFDEGPFANIVGDGDGEFYHYGLGKLGSSLAHLDPKKRGRTMCEVFGAYGWVEGLRLMKWMTDHLLVRGVNYFSPHAFSQAAFPDWDCPPHLYAHGNNPQYRHYHRLNHYTNRVCHLLSGGKHIATAAVLYHAEAEWAGAAMPFQKPVRTLLQGQLDCDVLPADFLVTAAQVREGRLLTGQEGFDCLVLPFSEALPAALLTRLVEMADQGLPLLFVDALPTRSCEGVDCVAALAALHTHRGVHIVSLAGLATQIRALGLGEIGVDVPQPSLRHYHVHHDDHDVYMFFNEHPYDTLTCAVSLPTRGYLAVYDAFENRLSALYASVSAGRAQVALSLSPYQSMLLISAEQIDVPASQSSAAQPSGTQTPAMHRREVAIAGPWAISMATTLAWPTFTPWREGQALVDLGAPDALPTFSGAVRYQTEFTLSEVDSTSGELDLGEVFDVAEVWANGQPAGVRICPPYRFEVGHLLHSGQNTLMVEVTTTLGRQQGASDFFSRFAPQDPSGLIGPVRLRV